ncbi:helix-turn-helix transcriptional regulator [Spirobacillus cienkowskii]|uniref:helix-turn-helix domain-containing protein n=1 Tax=Spirobacillus cienkowskii TaxID=495820 RepID=UPI0030D00A27
MKLTQEAYQNDKNALGVTYETAALVGSRLRHARELKKLSPSQVSARVKIRDRYIDAIEIGDWDVLPPGLNGRGLIRLYARELGVSIPEFEAFHHLQTIMVEKQSESLMEASSKKSKYHPAAEESAEVIRSISRKEYQKNAQSEHPEYHSSTSDEPSFAQARNTKIYSKPLYSQNNVTNASSPIVTPNIYEVLGLEVEEKATATKLNVEAKTKETVAAKRTLPTAEPIKKFTYPQESIEDVEKNVVNKTEIIEPKIQFKKDLNVSLNKNNHSEVMREKKKLKIDLNPLQIIGVMGFMMIFIFVSLFLFSRNSGQIKVTNLTAKQIETNIGESESLTNSQISEYNSKDKKSAGSTEKLKDTASQTKTTTLSPSQKLSNTLEVERIAKLNISSKVTITVEADGKQVYSGTRDSGVLDVPFKDKAEIVISDASKVSLVYEGINHGSLGYPGRKRKIILNAKPYVD